jgi:tRNA threonylcarbamoyladenosine biosynthesis protein TsaE
MKSARENIARVSNSEEETRIFGRELSAMLHDRDIIVLTGPLGAGKTCLIKGIAVGLGVPEEDTKSPSFTLVNEYCGRVPLYHFDLYRMKDESELYQIGWDEYLLRDGIVVVEWGEKAGDYLPEKRINISIEIISENGRNIKVDFID